MTYTPDPNADVAAPAHTLVFQVEIGFLTARSFARDLDHHYAAAEWHMPVQNLAPYPLLSLPGAALPECRHVAQPSHASGRRKLCHADSQKHWWKAPVLD